MMRLCCLSLSFTPEFTARQLDDLKFIDLCAQLQLDGVDWNLSSFQSLEPEHLKKIKRTCLERGLGIACVGVSNNFGRPAQEQDADRVQIRRGVEVASALGAPVVRLFAGFLGQGQTRQAVWQRTVAGLKWAAELGEKAGVVIGLQNHNHNNVTRTGDDVVRLLKEVDHPWCSHILDTGQYLGSLGASGARPEDPAKYNVYQSIERTAPLAVLVRAKLYRIKSGQEEWLDYERIVRILRGVKYNGFVSLVYEGWRYLDAMHGVPMGVTFLRKYLMR
jgi:sugar phosphate isomerase/epimerase